MAAFQFPRLQVGLAMLLSLTLSDVASAQELRPIEELQGIGITEKLEQQIPLDLKFKTSFGGEVTLEKYFQGDRATLLTLNYANCPTLCNAQLSGLADTIKELELTPGQDYQILTVSIDPNETPAAAGDVRQFYLDFLDREGANWTYLVGQQESITALADAVGFGYKFHPESGEYLHSAAIFLLTPEGKVARYLYGIQYDPETLRLSLLETAKGEVKSTMDRLILYCFQYDATKGGYTLAVLRLTRVAGAVTLVLLGTFIIRQMRRNRKIEQNAA